MAEMIFKKGDKVILGRHTKIDPSDRYSDCWEPDMDKYVGKETIIDTVATDTDDYGCRIYYVDIDDYEHAWRGRDMKPVVGKSKQISRSDNPPICKRCKQPAPWADPNPDFLCWGCRH